MAIAEPQSVLGRPRPRRCDHVIAAAAERLRSRVPIGPWPKPPRLARLKTELAPPKSDAERAADAATKAAESAAQLPKKPSSHLLISDPEEWQRQQDVYEEARTKAAVEAAKRDTLSVVNRQQADARKANEDHARGALREQFYEAYPVLRDSASIVDDVLREQFDAVLASGKVNKQLTPQEALALKKSEFADAAAKATRKVVGLMNAAKRIAPPVAAAPSPAASSASTSTTSTRTAAPEPKQPAKSREKYPKGSVSAVLAERRAQRA